MPLKLTDLTDELVVAIFLYLSSHEVHTCQLVCRRFNHIVRSSIGLQFIIELALSGYVEARNPRIDISLQEKCDLLRLHRLRRWNRSVSSIDTILMDAPDSGFDPGQPSLSHTPHWSRGPSLRDGFVTNWSFMSPRAYTDLQLDVIQLPSLNTGTRLNQWRLTQKGLNIQGSAVEPACDLLVLLECKAELSTDVYEPVPQLQPPQQPDSTGLGGYVRAHRPYLFHFRTLSTNEPHPSAFQSVFDCGLRTRSEDGFIIECLGDLVVARPNRFFAPRHNYGLLIYNWITGTLLDRRDEPYPGDLQVLTNEIIAIPRSTFAYNSQDSPMGIIELYRINWSDSSNPTLSCATILELPVVHSVPLPPPTPPQGPRETAIPVDPSRLAITCCCQFAPGSRTGQPAAYATGTPRIFAPAPVSQILRVQIKPSVTYHSPPGEEQVPSAWETSCYVPLQVVLDAVKSSCRESSCREELPRRIQWDQWGSQTRWLHLTHEFCENPIRAPTGTRCILTRYASRQEQTLAVDPNVWPAPRRNFGVNVLLLDFNPAFVRQVERNANRGDHSEHEGKSGAWIYQPATTDHMSPVAPLVPHSRWRWLSEGGADKAVAPYAWSQFNHEHFKSVFRRSPRKGVMIDDEHRQPVFGGGG
ncbi:hypothetical protein FRC09_011968 [Ceratobasidium sp. 395]|nr:hypothetical protein FRC09_011968 [Ceratobasidium sp. 395]